MQRINILRIALSCSLASLTLLGCDDDDDSAKSVCAQAGEVFINDCGFEQGEDDGSGAACEGAAAAQAQCAVDFPAEACEAFDNFADPSFSNAYTECLAAAGG